MGNGWNEPTVEWIFSFIKEKILWELQANKQENS